MMSDTTVSNRETALALAAAGFSVFPCHAGGEKAKSPMPFIKWREASTTNERQIAQWWQKWPAAAIGLDLAKSGLIVIDADRHDESADGVEAFGALMGAHGFDPDSAPLVATPSAGNHHYFRQRDGETLGNSEGALRKKGINIRGHGGYVIAPGTVMGEFALKDGRIIPAGAVYELWGDLADAPVIPDWLHSLITTPLEPVRQKLEPVIPGSHDQAEIDEIAELLGYISPDSGYQDWLAALMAVHAATGGSSTGLAVADDWSARGSKYKGTKELSAKWKSFKGQGVNLATLAALARENGADLSAIAIKHRGHEHDYDPVEAAEAARRLIEHHDGTLADAETGEVYDPPSEHAEDEEYGGSTEYLDFPDELMNPPGVVGEITNWICESTGEPIRIHALGAALVTVGTILSRKVYSESRPTGTHLYIGIICPSGIGKDHPQTSIKRILDTLPKYAGGSLHVGWAQSAPKLGVRLNEIPGSVMIADEFAEKLASTRSRNASVSMAAINEALKEIWGRSQGSYEMPGALTRSDIIIQKPGMSFFGAATIRDFKESLVSKDVTSGLYNRFLFLPRHQPVPLLPEIDGMVSIPDTITQKCKWLYNCLPDMEELNSRRGDTYPENPVMVPFDDDAREINEHNRQYQREMQALSDEDQSLSLYGRYAEQIKRVAMIIACGRSPEDLKQASITANDMAFAKNLVRWSIEQTVLMVRRDMIESIGQSQYKLVLEAIRKSKRVSADRLYRKINGRIKKRDLEDTLKLLETSGNIEIQTVVNSKPGRPPTFYKYVRG